MAVEDIAVEATNLITLVGSIVLWLQALGIILLLWIVFHFIFLFLNRKRMKEVYKIKEDMVRIEGKIDKILRAVERSR